MFERFDSEARRVVVRSQEIAESRGYDYIGTAHLLLATAESPCCRQAMCQAGATSEDLAQLIESQGPPIGTDHVPFTSDAKDLMVATLTESLRLGHRHIGPEHLLLALLSLDAGDASDLLDATNADRDAAEALILDHLVALDRRAPARYLMIHCRLDLGADEVPTVYDLMRAVARLDKTSPMTVEHSRLWGSMTGCSAAWRR